MTFDTVVIVTPTRLAMSPMVVAISKLSPQQIFKSIFQGKALTVSAYPNTTIQALS
jgi:hypothetical protein